MVQLFKFPSLQGEISSAAWFRHRRDVLCVSAVPVYFLWMSCYVIFAYNQIIKMHLLRNDHFCFISSKLMRTLYCITVFFVLFYKTVTDLFWRLLLCRAFHNVDHTLTVCNITFIIYLYINVSKSIAFLFLFNTYFENLKPYKL